MSILLAVILATICRDLSFLPSAEASALKRPATETRVEMAKAGEAYRKALHYGIELVGGCQLNGTILSSFGSGKYGKIPFEFVRDNNYHEYVLELNLNPTYSAPSMNPFSLIGSFDGFTPFCQYYDARFEEWTSWLSTVGSDWNVWRCKKNGVSIRWGTTQRLKAVYDNGVYTFYEWTNGAWNLVTTLTAPNCATSTGLYWQFGTNRGANNPFAGTINLDHCYIVNGEDLWWEFQPGSYERANGLE